jgi:iron complex outermembrane receptor protein
VQELFDARDAGTINAATPLADASDLIGIRGRPKWRANGTLTWSNGGFQVGAMANYIGKLYDTDFLDVNGNPYVLKATTTFNLYGQYRFRGGALDDLRLRVGARNLFDKAPPITADGYLGAQYVAYRRYWYLSVGKSF